jgi:hypothetical protein
MIMTSRVAHTEPPCSWLDAERTEAVALIACQLDELFAMAFTQSLSSCNSYNILGRRHVLPGVVSAIHDMISKAKAICSMGVR